MKIDGACHCGFISFKAEADLDKVIICHCTDCQSLSGAAFRTVAFVTDSSFQLLSGEMKLYVKTSESGNKREQTFCPACGSPIYSTSVGDGPKFLGIRVGTIRQRDRLKPVKQLWARSAQDWISDLESIPKIELQ